MQRKVLEKREVDIDDKQEKAEHDSAERAKAEAQKQSAFEQTKRALDTREAQIRQREQANEAAAKALAEVLVYLFCVSPSVCSCWMCSDCSVRVLVCVCRASFGPRRQRRPTTAGLPRSQHGNRSVCVLLM